MKLQAKEGNKITDKGRTFFNDFIYVPENYNTEDYEEVGYEIWGAFLNEISPQTRAEEIEAQIKSLEEEVRGIDWDTFVSSLPSNSKTLDEVKKIFIEKSKQNLAQYLEDNPLYSNCHKGEYAYYKVTAEKQMQLTQKFTAHVALTQVGIPDVMTWNSTGLPCEEFGDQEILQLIFEMNTYVTPLVSKQQHMEVEIVKCESQEELKVIDVSF